MAMALEQGFALSQNDMLYHRSSRNFMWSQNKRKSSTNALANYIGGNMKQVDYRKK